MATSLMVMVRLVFGDENTPSANFTSAASTLSACAAIALAFSITFSVAIVKAALDIVEVREPPVPSP